MLTTVAYFFSPIQVSLPFVFQSSQSIFLPLNSSNCSGVEDQTEQPFDFLAQNLHEIYFRKVVINDLITSTLCCNMLGRNNEILIITSTEHDTRAEGHSRPAGQTKYYRGSSEVNFCSWNILILKLKMTRGGEYWPECGEEAGDWPLCIQRDDVSHVKEARRPDYLPHPQAVLRFFSLLYILPMMTWRGFVFYIRMLIIFLSCWVLILWNDLLPSGSAPC